MSDAISRLAPDVGTRSRDAAARPNLVEWLRTGRLTLVGPDRQPISAESWEQLPAEVRVRTTADFERVARGNAKAVVLFLR